jgi:hypothetical protein
MLPSALSWKRSVLLTAAFALAWACGLDWLAPPPSADTSAGSEAVFASGLEPREIPRGQGPQRWMGPEAVFRFRNLPSGPGRLEVAVHGQKSPVLVVVDGVILGQVASGMSSLELDVPAPRARALDVVLRSEGFVTASGRRLAALLDRVRLSPARPHWPALALVLGFVAVAWAALVAAAACGLRPAVGMALAAAMNAVQALTLWPSGVVRSSYATSVTLLLIAALLLGAWAARMNERRFVDSACFTLATVLVIALVQVLAATSPLMVVSDAVFHANKLAAVAAGDFFPTSMTQHARPFRIPYGVSFYLLLSPLYRAGLDAVALVRWGAALSGVAAAVVLYRFLLPEGALRAAAAVVLLQLLPGSFDLYSYGNLSNVFGQSMTVIFFCWWAGGAPGGAFVGGALVLLCATAHLSSSIVLLALIGALVWAGGDAIRRDRRRLGAVALGLAVAGLYYLHFAGLVLEQLPRLLEGGGQGGGPAIGVWGALRAQLSSVRGQWGLPALVLACWGWPHRTVAGVGNALGAFWLAGALLLLPALLTPLEVRYLYALTLPLAAAAGLGLCRLNAAGKGRRALGWLLFAAQLTIAVQGILEAVLHRYRF